MEPHALSDSSSAPQTDRSRPGGDSAAVRLLAPPIALLVGLVGFGAWFQKERIEELEVKITLLETDRQTTNAHQDGVRDGLERLGEEIERLTTRIGEAATEAREARTVAERIHSTEDRLSVIGAAVEATTASLGELERQVGPDALEAVLSEREGRLQESWDAFEGVLREEVSDSQERLLAVEERMQAPRDLDRMWSELMGPVVQLAGESSVGSGVLLKSEPHDAGGYRTYLLTAWHVVRDIQGSPTKRDMPIPVTIYADDGSLRHEEATLLVYQADLDAALLELRTADALPHGASLASSESLADARIFDQIYAVGCPLGNDPIPTYGELATLNHVVDGEIYWMINAPTYIGNSGGGIFDSETHELLGIFSKIYTHGSLRPTIVPHMGLVTPLPAIYDWLDSQGYANVHSAAGERSTARVASAGR